MQKICTSQLNGPSRFLTKVSDWVPKFKAFSTQWAVSVDHKPMLETRGVECMVTALGLARILHREGLQADGAFAIVFINAGRYDRIVLNGSIQCSYFGTQETFVHKFL